MIQGLRGHVLIIEDEMLIAMEIENLLADMGFQTFDIADSPDRALASAMAHRPDLITADVRIIGGTGIEAVNAIIATLGPVPVVFVTGNIDDLRDQDPFALVEKPISARSLAMACERVFDRAA
nr:response regulator [Phenylobacterium sp. LH3H17]